MAHIKQLKNSFDSWNESQTPEWFEKHLESLSTIYSKNETGNNVLSFLLAEETLKCYHENAFDLRSVYTHLQNYSKWQVQTFQEEHKNSQEETKVRNILVQINQQYEQYTADLSSSNPEHYVRTCIRLGKVYAEKEFFERIIECPEEKRTQFQQLFRCLQLVRFVNVMQDAEQTRNFRQTHATDDNCEDPEKIMTALITSAVRNNVSFEKVKILINIFFSQDASVREIKIVKKIFKQRCLDQFKEEISNISMSIYDGKIEEFESTTFNVDIDYYKYSLMSVFNCKKEREVVDNILNESLVKTRSEYKAVEKKLRFLQCFRSYLCHSKDLGKVCDKLGLNVSSLLSVKDLIKKIKQFSSDSSNDQLTKLQDNARNLGCSNESLIATVITEIVSKLNVLPTISIVKLEDRYIIEVIGEHLVLSNILKKVENELGIINHPLKEVHFVCSQVFHVDADLSEAFWHGVNVFVRTNLVKVHGSVVWNLSGRDNNHVYSQNAGKTLDGEGKQGKDGRQGEDGGHLHVLASEFDHMNYLSIYSNGGSGSKGQDGGDGKNGKNGFGITKTEILDHYKLSKLLGKQFLYDLKINDSIRDIVDSIKADCRYCSVEEHMEGNNIFIQAETERGFEITFSFSWNAVLPSHWYFVAKGSKPTLAKKGGLHGSGGHRGYPGRVIVNNVKNDSKIDVEKHTNFGNKGLPGVQGKSGKMGNNEWDMAFFKGGSNEPVCIGKDHKRRINIEYYESKTENSVYCWYKQRYTRMSCDAVTMTQLDHNQITSDKREIQQSDRVNKKSFIFESELTASYNKRFQCFKEDLLLEKLSKIQNIQKLVVETPIITHKSQVNVERQVKVKHHIKILPEPEGNDQINNTFSDIHEVETDFSDSVLTNLTVDNDSLKYWNELSTIRMKPEHFTNRFLDDYKKLFEKAHSNKFWPEINKVKENITVKIQLAKLERISRALYCNQWDVLAVEHMIEINELHSFLHETLGNMKDFFTNHNSKKLVNKLSQYLKDPEEGVLEVPIKMFVTEASMLGTAEPCLIACNSQYLNSQQQNQHNQFDYGSWISDEEILKAYKTMECKKGPHSRSFRELLARAFNVNVRVFAQKEDGTKMLLDDHFPGIDKKQINLLLKNGKFIQLQFDEKFKQIDDIRHHKTKIYCCSIKTVMENSNRSHKILNKNAVHAIVTGIAQFISVDNRGSVVEQLQQIALNEKFAHILKSIFLRFTNEGIHCSLPEFELLLNCILDAINEEKNYHVLLNWIVLSHPQTLWIHELILIQLEDYFGTWLPHEFVWRQLLWRIKNKGVLILLHSKLKQHVYPLSQYYMDQTLHSMTWVSIKVNDLSKLDLLHWCYALEQLFIKQNCLVETGTTSETGTDNSVQKKVKSQLVAMIKRIGIKDTMSRFNFSGKTCEMFYSEGELDFVKNEQNIFENVIFQNGLINRMKLITKHNINNPTVLTQLTSSDEALERMVKVLNIPYVSHENHVLKQNNTVPSDIQSVFKRIDDVLKKKRGYCLKEIQRNAVLTLVRDERNNLVQVPTGEGKSLIIVAVAITKVLRGESVDIVTSSSVLAKRDVEENKFIYDHFKINVAHNCDEDCDTRKKVYSNNQVVYGDLASFQCDYLLHKFYQKDVLGKREFENIIIDEADSMLLDKGNEILYLSHELPDMDKLESVYVFIWLQVNKNKQKDTIEHERLPNNKQQDKNEIKTAVLWQLYGILKLDDLDQLGSEFSKIEKETIWQGLVDAGIINKNGKLITDSIDSYKLSSCVEIDAKYLDRLIFLLNKSVNREKEILIPNYLRSFVELHLDSWIDAANKALTMDVDRDYVLDVDRRGNTNVTIIDRDTGTDLVDCEWDEALHQFVQIKHICKMSLQSLKAVFISYASFFKLYKNLLGLSGTFGSIYEMDKLKHIYNVNFAFLPPSNEDKFIENETQICASREEWISAILNSAEKLTIEEKRAILIICDTVKEVKILHAAFKAKNVTNVRTYKRESEDFGEAKLSQGEIVIATNLAGRGTNIKITDKLKLEGGLHVCLTYLPRNSRIEQQAFKRAARNGADGSGQLIVMDHENHRENTVDRIFHLKQERDFREFRRVYEMKKFYESSIVKAESWFEMFTVEYKQLSKFFSTSKLTKNNKELTKILLDSCLYSWAYWLDEKWVNIEFIGDNSTFLNFLIPLNGLRTDKAENLGAWVDEKLEHLIILRSYGTYPSFNPTQMTKLGWCLLQEKNSKIKDLAIKMFDSVIKLEPNFSEAAHYYKAYALSKENNKNDFEEELRAVSTLLHIRIKNYKRNVTKIEKCSAKFASSILKIDDYRKQTDNFCELYYLIIYSVHSILGHPVIPTTFTSGSTINESLSRKIFETLFEKGILKKPTSKSGLTEQELKNFGYHHGTSSSELFKCLSKPVYGFEMIDDLKENVFLPSRERFWKELVHNNVLEDDKKYVIIDYTKLTELLPEWQKLYREKIICQRNDILLYPLAQQSQQSSAVIFDKNHFKETLGSEKFGTLKRLGVLSFQRKAQCNLNSRTIENFVFERFDSISLEDFAKTSISEKDSKAILKYLEEISIIVAKHGSTIKYDLLADWTEIENLDLATYNIYENTVKELLYYCFSYRIALQSIIKQRINNCYIPLPVKPHYCLVADLFMGKILEPVRVANFDSKDLQECLAIVTPDKSTTDTVELILKHMKATSGSIKMIPLAEFGKLDNESERKLFTLNGFEMIFKVSPNIDENIWVQLGLGTLGVTFGKLISFVPVLSLAGDYVEKNGLQRISSASQISVVHANHNYSILRSNKTFKKQLYEKTRYYNEHKYCPNESTMSESYVRTMKCMIEYFIPRLDIANDLSKLEMVFKNRLEVLFTHLQNEILMEMSKLIHFNESHPLKKLQSTFGKYENNIKTTFNQLSESVLIRICEMIKTPLSVSVVRQIILNTIINLDKINSLVNQYQPDFQKITLQIIESLHENSETDHAKKHNTKMKKWFLKQVSKLLEDCIKQPLMIQSAQQLRRFIELRIEFQLGDGMCDF